MGNEKWDFSTSYTIMCNLKIKTDETDFNVKYSGIGVEFSDVALREEKSKIFEIIFIVVNLS
jgi:hypothetical protein